jgi:hypothetical protein
MIKIRQTTGREKLTGNLTKQNRFLDKINIFFYIITICLKLEPEI